MIDSDVHDVVPTGQYQPESQTAFVAIVVGITFTVVILATSLFLGAT